jgi:peptidoglycan/LPS O-acetylase OafA/YrhL
VAKIHFRNLDGLRFVLALIVFFAHSSLGVVLSDISPFNFLDKIFINIFSSGGLAVSFFFTLSGYLITYLILVEHKETGQLDVKKFYLRRALRIWPLYYSVLFFSFFIYPWIKTQLGYADENPFSFLSQFFFLSNFDNIFVDEQGLIGLAPMMISINWSIAIEEQFYFFWPLLFLLTGARRFIFVIIPVIIVSWFANNLMEGASLYYHTLAVISDLGVGALFAYICFYKAIFVSQLSKMPRFVIIFIYACGFSLILYPEIMPSYFPARIITSVFFAFIICEQNFAKESIFKFGNNHFLSSLGKYTYSFYLLHPIGIQVAIITFRYLHMQRADSIGHALLYVAIAFIAAMIFSFISYRYIELFFLHLKDRFYSTTKQR